MPNETVPLTTSVSVRPAYRPSRKDLASNTIAMRIQRAVFPLNGKVMIAWQLDRENPSYLTVDVWQLQAGGPAGVHAIRQYVRECLDRADGMQAVEMRLR